MVVLPYPGCHWNGTDSFTYRVSDGELDSAGGDSDLEHRGQNDAPLVPARIVTLTRMNRRSSICWSAPLDVDGDIPCGERHCRPAARQLYAERRWHLDLHASPQLEMAATLWTMKSATAPSPFLPA